MELSHIPPDRLSVSALNMRHAKKAPDLADILPSVRARGILQPLLVRPKGDGGDFEIVAGRRRYLAAKVIAEERGAVDPLPCAVMEPGDDAEALEASLIENTARLEPDEMRQYETFVRLAKAGKSVAEIAATFGLTEVLVKRRLALGNLLPKIREACRREAIDAETARHLTLASKAQQRDWLALFEDPGQVAPRGWQLKQWLFGGAGDPHLRRPLRDRGLSRADCHRPLRRGGLLRRPGALLAAAERGHRGQARRAARRRLGRGRAAGAGPLLPALGAREDPEEAGRQGLHHRLAARRGRDPRGLAAAQGGAVASPGGGYGGRK